MFFFDGSEETRIIFDVSKLKDEMMLLVKQKKFIFSNNERLSLTKEDIPQLEIRYNDQKMGMRLGLKGGYYLPYYEFIGIRGERIVFYNSTDGVLIFYDQQTR